MTANTLNICPNVRTNFNHVFKWRESDGKTICLGCGCEKTVFHELEDWEAKKQ